MSDKTVKCQELGLALNPKPFKVTKHRERQRGGFGGRLECRPQYHPLLCDLFLLIVTALNLSELCYFMSKGLFQELGAQRVTEKCMSCV